MLTYFIFSTGVAVVMIAALAIVGWLTGTPALATWSAGSVPMAPATALISAALGASLMLCSAQRPHRRCAAAFWLNLVALAASIAMLFLRASGRYPSWEGVGFASVGTVNGFPTGFVSPFAAAGLAAAAIASIVQHTPRVTRMVALISAIASSGAVVVIGLCAVLTAWLGYPILLTSTHVPMAANTGVLFLVLGSGLAATGIRLSDRRSRRGPKSDRSWRPFAVAFIVLLFLTVSSSYAFYRNEEREMRVEEDTKLDGVTVVHTVDAIAAAASPSMNGVVLRTRALANSDWSLVWESRSHALRADLWTRLRWVMTFATLLLINAAAILTLVWHSQRVARYRERAAMTEALRLQAIRERQLMARSPAVLYTLRIDGQQYVTTDMSANAERILGYTVAEVLDPGWFPAHVFPPDLDAAMAATASLATFDDLVNEFRFIRKDGSLLWISNQMTVTRRDDGKPVEISGAWHDISARRAAEGALRESEERLRLALSSAAQGLWDINVQTDQAVVSQEYATMLGYDPAEFRETNTAWRERLHPEDRPAAVAVYRDYIEGKRDSYSSEFRQKTKAGDWKWILSIGKIISRTPDGRPLRMLGTHTDITARKLAELRSERLAELYEALSKCNFAIARSHSEEELLPQVCEAAAGVRGVAMAWIGMTDSSGRVVPRAGVGPGADALFSFGLTTDDAPMGRGPTGTAIREGRACWRLDLATNPASLPWRDEILKFGWAAAGSMPLSCANRVVGAFTICATTPAVFDDDCRRLLMEMSTGVSSALDHLASERRRAAGEEALRESESRYRALFEDADVPRTVLDPQTGRIVDANAAAVNFYGWPRSVLLTMSVGDINTSNRDDVRNALAIARTGQQRTFEVRHRLSSGDVRDIQIFSTSISVKGRPLLLSTAFDITERKRADAALRATLEEREALLKEVHHRVKNNLQVISSLLRLERDRHTDVAVKSAMGEMQLRILSMALLHETLYRSTDLGCVDLSAYLSDLANQVFRSAAPPSGSIALRLNLTSVQVDMDHAIPCGLLVNEILSNCLKHAFPDGRAGTIAIDLHRAPENSAYVLRIRDDGVGLPADFEARQTASLGVHLIRALATQLKAALSIDSAPGATFSITFAANGAAAVKDVV